MGRILVVDDDPDFVATTRIVLEHAGHVVSSAANSDEALACVEEDPPDLIILDVIMSSVLDGLRVSRELERHVEHRSIPILMVTSIAGTNYAELFPTDEYVRVDGFLSKPVSPTRLAKEVEQLLQV